MTSSLVGSEMCIRDRLCFGHPPPASPNVTDAMGLAPHTDKSEGNQTYMHCLLYTSDAADDM
eukprot:11984390-Prorocentrum_lima.AAC.1